MTAHALTLPAAQAADPWANSLAAALESAGMFGGFLSAVTKAGMWGQLVGPGPITIFAPTDAAFAQFPVKTWLDFKNNQTSLLRTVLNCHFVHGLITADQFADKNISAKSVQGSNFVIEGIDGPRIGGARISPTDIMADNGVIHGISNVLWFAASVRPQRRSRDGDR
jgi:uncharacterized surface protein with fasciclin (FAS1) repeats